MTCPSLVFHCYTQLKGYLHTTSKWVIKVYEKLKLFQIILILYNSVIAMPLYISKGLCVPIKLQVVSMSMYHPFPTGCTRNCGWLLPVGKRVQDVSQKQIQMFPDLWRFDLRFFVKGIRIQQKAYFEFWSFPWLAICSMICCLDAKQCQQGAAPSQPCNHRGNNPHACNHSVFHC